MSEDEDRSFGEEEEEHKEPVLKNIIITRIFRKGDEMTELIRRVNIERCINEDGAIQLRSLTKLIKSQYNYSFYNCEISYWLHIGKIYVNCGLEPINKSVLIEKDEYDKYPDIMIKARQSSVSLIHKLMNEEVNENQGHPKDRDERPDINKCRRTKERKIGFIVQKVHQWRRCHRVEKKTLEDAAKNVCISKKSLDDYLLQIRQGKSYGFNFNEHKNDKVGVLRDFVRKKKKIGEESKKMKNQN